MQTFFADPTLTFKSKDGSFNINYCDAKSAFAPHHSLKVWLTNKDNAVVVVDHILDLKKGGIAFSKLQRVPCMVLAPFTTEDKHGGAVALARAAQKAGAKGVLFMAARVLWKSSTGDTLRIPSLAYVHPSAQNAKTKLFVVQDVVPVEIDDLLITNKVELKKKIALLDEHSGHGQRVTVLVTPRPRPASTVSVGLRVASRADGFHFGFR